MKLLKIILGKEFDGITFCAFCFSSSLLRTQLFVLW